ncbi:Murein hydrolase activator NlpD precursor [Roseivivax jejudonensis]|uniref:Murein hydrolase activator NlpD n=1 Tax=Roseivivax jejudonensis TaxID=1529041 RepID=A0A1X6Z2C0_9RHOB|nr:peptidoglycan DD-metalloendopeptidase family protein [Roseivivax jejudonensis]SLN38869.1 Murein hydrolase activator NlpD precursor [Roseivivax jejudonensis]
MRQSSLRPDGVRLPRLALAGSALMVLAACQGPMDLDMRGRLGGSVDTSMAAVSATADRPEPDDRGVISYPSYQVVVARRGDTVTDVARRIGMPPQELADFNGIQTGDTLREGEILALPRRVAEPSAATGAVSTAPLGSPGSVDITTLAGNALDRAPQTSASQSPRPTPSASNQDGVEPVRHQVERGETAFTIARLYNVTPRALAEWNGLDQNFTLREGQYLMIPVATEPRREASASAAVATEPVTEPGRGSPTPTPPSSAQPLPQETPEPRTAAAAPPPPPDTEAPDIGETTRASASEGGEFLMPVSGSIIREYAKGRNDGIDIAASAGTPVKAAADGTVAAITTNTDDIPILVVKHPGDLLTVYTHIDGISVSKGDSVSRGQSIGRVMQGDPARMHFEVRDGFESVDPMTYLQG